jgi:hypothetical protein
MPNSNDSNRVYGISDRVVTMTPLISGVTDTNVIKRYDVISCGLMGDSTYGPQSSGGWQIVDRPKSIAATQWFDRSPYSLSFSGVIQKGIDYNASGADLGFPGEISLNMSIESEISQMESWVDRVVGSSQYQPPVLTVSGPVPGTERLWVVYSILWKDALRHPQAGFRYQQNFDIVLYEYTSPLSSTLSQYNKNSPAAAFITAVGASEENAGTQQYALYTIREGDTLASIVAKLYQNPTQQSAKTISTMGAFLLAINGIRDETLIPNMAGRIIKLPRDITGSQDYIATIVQTLKKSNN